MVKTAFISYSSQDRASAEQLCRHLEADQIECWIAPRDMVPGHSFPEQIIDAIEGCVVMVVVLSDNANASRFVKNEVERAFTKKKTLIPLRIEDVQPSKALELFIASAHWIDAWGPPLQTSATALAAAIRQHQEQAQQATGAKSRSQSAPAPQSRQVGATRQIGATGVGDVKDKAAGGMRVVLEVRQGPLAGKRFVFAQHATFMVGRSPKVHCQIPGDSYFSRFHFMIETAPPACFLRDLGSRNGTFVNDQRVKEAHLKKGDIVVGGKTLMQVVIEADRPTSEKAVGPAESPTPTRTRALRCKLCGKLAEDTQLGGLTDTRRVAYVCKKCCGQRSPAQQMIPNYEILEELGQGTLGPVFKARHVPTGKVVVLKMLPPNMAGNPQAAKMFLRQMHLVVSLDHPNIVPVVEMGEAGGDLWIASAFVEGTDAATLTERAGGKLPLRDGVDIISQVLSALQNAHDHDLVHRDVKPANIIVTGEPPSYTAKLADFGLMRGMDDVGLSGITRTGEIRGTVPFMPPEQVIDCRLVRPTGDIYQAAATLYWLLTGNYVYDFDARDRHGEARDPFLVILEDKIVPVRKRDATILQSVATVIETALHREPKRRFQTANEMAFALCNAAR